MSAGEIGKSRAIVVIATYNEAQSIGALLNAITYPVIVVDDNSPDCTADIAQKCGASIFSRPRKLGIASAYRAGFEIALREIPDYVIQIDAGLTHQPEDIDRLLHLAQKGSYGLVIGSRFFKKVPLTFRSIISRVAAWLMRLRGIDVCDATNGFRCWDSDTLRQVIKEPFRAKNFAFQLEALFRTRELGHPIGEVSIDYRMTNSTFRLGMLWEALRIWATLAFSR